ncbi:MAG: Eco57I restriction-modification methylase domain-containing protein, partial [Anaerolineae bacterium]|nr:Eco57I restriction-modification methylase domain-containing protein [Anaerolineae bacterium]
ANIRCGNSLIGSDYYQQATLGLMDDETMYRINAFDWEKGFPRAMAAGGFDAVIGNPPYVRQEALKKQKEYLKSHYKVYHGVADLYTYFIEKSLGLLKPVGLFSMIVSNKWLRSAYGRPLRSLLTTHASVLEIVDFAGLPVFSGATVRTLILVCVPRPGQTESVCYLAPVPLDDFRAIHSGEQVTELVVERAIHLPAQNMSSAGWSLSSPAVQALVEKTRKSATPLKAYAGPPFFGIKTGLNKAFIVGRETRDRLVASDPRNADIIRPVVGGRDVRRYSIEFKSKYLIWTYIGVPIRHFPAVFDHLHQYKGQLQKRSDQGDHWWELRACDYYDRFSWPKIMYPDIATSCRFVVDREGYLGTNTTYFIPGDDLYLLGILNSALGNFYLAEACAGLEGGGTTYLRFFGQYMEAFPVRTIDFDDPSDVARHDRMVALVERMLARHNQLADAKTPQTNNVLQQQIEVTDRAIDTLVYELYELTDEEIAIVEKESMS